MVVIGFAPPYYPSMNCRFLDNTDFNIVSLITDYREYLDTRGYLLKVEEYFMGINDTSYCALEKDVASYQVVLDSLAHQPRSMIWIWKKLPKFRFQQLI